MSNSSRIFCGKFITIYPRNNEEFYEIIEIIYKKTKDDYGPQVNTDRKYKDSKIIYYRYGAFTKKSKLKCKKAVYFQPNNIEDLLLDTSKNRENNDSIILNDKYKIIDILQVKNSGGIYLVEDIKSEIKYIVKEAQKYINFNSKISCEDLRKNEKKYLIEFEKFEFIPKYIDDFYQEDSYFLVTEYIENSVSIKDWFTKNNVISLNPFNKEMCKKYSDKVINIINQAINIIEKVNSCNILLEDISKLNFIISKNKLYFIDLELCTQNDEISIRRKEAFKISSSKENIKNRDKIKLGFLFLELITNYNPKINYYENKGLYFELLLNIIKAYNLSYEIYFKISELISYNDNSKNLFNFTFDKKKFNLVEYYPCENLITEINYLFLITETFYYNDFCLKKLKYNELELLYKKILTKVNFKDPKIEYIFLLLSLNRIKKYYDVEINEYKKMKQNYIKKFIKNNKFKYKEVYTPYLLGLTGFLLLLIEEDNNCNIDKYLNNLKSYFSNKINFQFGISGLIYFYIRFYNLKKYTYLKNKINILTEFLLTFINYRGVQRGLVKEKDIFFKGEKGIEYVLFLKNKYLK